VDYAVREADLYITKRSRTSSLFYSDEEEFHDAESQLKRQSTAVSPTKEPNAAGSRGSEEDYGEDDDVEPEVHGLLRPVKGLMSRVTNNFNLRKKTTKEDPYEPKGFHVLNRQPIKPTKKEPVRFQVLSTPAEASEEYLGEGVAGQTGGEVSETDDLLGPGTSSRHDTEQRSTSVGSTPAMFQIPKQSRSISTGLRVDTGSFKEGT
jgi:hypothetical protein